MSALEERMAFAMQAIGLPEPVREYRFDWCCQHLAVAHYYVDGKRRLCQLCPIESRHHLLRHGRAWKFDFAWPELKVALEVDGGTRSGGRHVRAGGFERDAEKLNEAARQGWTVVRVTAAMVKDGRALNEVEAALRLPAPDQRRAEV